MSQVYNNLLQNKKYNNVIRVHSLITWNFTDLKAHYHKQRVEVQTIIVPATHVALAHAK